MATLLGSQSCFANKLPEKIIMFVMYVSSPPGLCWDFAAILGPSDLTILHECAVSTVFLSRIKFFMFVGINLVFRSIALISSRPFCLKTRP